MTPEEHTRAIGELQDDLSAIAQALAEIKGTLNNGIKQMVTEHKVQLATIRNDVSSINQVVVGHVAKEEAMSEVYKRMVGVGITVTGAVITLLLSATGYLLVHPVGLQ